MYFYHALIGADMCSKPAFPVSLKHHYYAEVRSPYLHQSSLTVVCDASAVYVVFLL